MEEKSTHASTGEGAHTRWSAHAPTAFGANTRRSDAALCDASSASANTPAACHTPRRGGAPSVRKPAKRRDTSDGSPASHRAARTSHTPELRRRAPADAEIEPPRDATTNAPAPLSESHAPVTTPSAPLPPVRTCEPSTAASPAAGTRITTLPMLEPACIQRKAACAPRSRPNTRSGRPCSTSASARDDSKRSVRHIHHGTCSIVESSAIATYRECAAASCRS